MHLKLKSVNWSCGLNSWMCFTNLVMCIRYLIINQLLSRYTDSRKKIRFQMCEWSASYFREDGTLLTRGICFVVPVCFLLLLTLQLCCWHGVNKHDASMNWALPAGSLHLLCTGSEWGGCRVPGDSCCFKLQQELGLNWADISLWVCLWWQPVWCYWGKN